MTGPRATRPFVDRPIADLDLAEQAARQAVISWGGEATALASSVELLRRGMNALFGAGDVVLRVGAATASARLSHELAAGVADLGVPSIAAIDGWWADVSGLAVTAWERVDTTSMPVDWEAIGVAVRKVHVAAAAEFVPSGYPVPPPTNFPWWDFDAMLGELAPHLDGPALEGLRRAVERNQGWRELVLTGAVVCHGDVHPGNVLVGPKGSLLIDWDLLCWAPPAWDHAMLITYADRWGGSPDVYPAFASGYGTSMADDELALTLGELRNVAATLMRVRAGLTQPAARVEAERRLSFWRGDAHAPIWNAQ